MLEFLAQTYTYKKLMDLDEQVTERLNELGQEKKEKKKQIVQEKSVPQRSQKEIQEKLESTNKEMVDHRINT